MDAILERSRELKQALVDFVLEAEGDLAEALESYVAAKSSREANRYDVVYDQKLLIDSFLTEGKVGKKTPIDLFIESRKDLSASDCDLLNSWHSSFIGLFTIVQTLPEGFELMNWLTAKHYFVNFNDPVILEELARFKAGEILLTRISPVTDTRWIFSGPYQVKGRLGNPKLAVAIGNFKDNYRSALYSDAPDLLEQAWESVAEYHQQFLEFFGGEEVTLPGYQLNKKITELQELMTKRQLAAAGVDPSKSLSELVEEVGVTEAELQAAAEEVGAESMEISQLFDRSQGSTKMVMPKVELPAEVRKAEQVTVFTHPRWGQIVLPTYTQIKAILESEIWEGDLTANKLLRKYLEDPAIKAFVWHKLAQLYPTQLERALQAFLDRPEFELDSDLNTLLQSYGKPLEPELPEIASVPLHLHNLFQEALAEVNKSKAKSRGKLKEQHKGFNK